MEYKTTIKMSMSELNYYNNLLQLDLNPSGVYYNEHDIKRLCAKQNDYIGIATINFDNGNYITLDIASGDDNYYDNVVLYDSKGNTLEVLDCEYKIDNFKIYYEGDTYIIEIEGKW